MSRKLTESEGIQTSEVLRSEVKITKRLKHNSKKGGGLLSSKKVDFGHEPYKAEEDDIRGDTVYNTSADPNAKLFITSN